MHPRFSGDIMDGEPVCVGETTPSCRTGDGYSGRTPGGDRIRHLSDGKQRWTICSIAMSHALTIIRQQLSGEAGKHEEFSELMEDLGFYWLGRNTRPQL
jgi:hypothetical protein